MFTPGSSRLPAFRTLPALALAAVATVLLCALLYYLPQHWHRGTPVLLPLTIVDRVVPFWPWSGLVYFAAFGFLAGTFLALRDLDAASRFLYANLLAQVIAALVFVLWPTAYPRADFPLPADTRSLGAALVAFCRSADLPVNCLPSLHVSTVVICLATQRHCIPAARRIYPLLLAMGLLLVASTLTFKQHYLLDGVAGVVLGLCSWWVCFRWRGFALSAR
jgi:hypothetical protein